MAKEIDKQFSFLGFKLTLFISFNPLLFYFILDFKKVKLINIFYYKPSKDFWFRLFGKKVFSNVGGKNGDANSVVWS